MNKSDKYYLKNGKLELSMLDDGDDDIKQVPAAAKKNRQRDEMLKGLDLQHTRRLRNDKQGKQSRVKVSNEIYSTLHTMGQYLTKNEDRAGSFPVKKPINSAKAQLIEQLASTVKVQSMELPPAPSKEERMKNVSITKADEITEVSEQAGVVNTQVPIRESQAVEEKKLVSAGDEWDRLEQEETEKLIQESQQEQAASVDEDSDFKQISGDEALHLGKAVEIDSEDSQYEQEKKEIELEETSAVEVPYSPMDKEVEASYEKAQNMSEDHIEKKEAQAVSQDVLQQAGMELEEYQTHKEKQEDIDKLVESFFVRRPPDYSFTRDLKKHIDKKIKQLSEQE